MWGNARKSTGPPKCPWKKWYPGVIPRSDDTDPIKSTKRVPRGRDCLGRELQWNNNRQDRQKTDLGQASKSLTLLKIPTMIWKKTSQARNRDFAATTLGNGYDSRCASQLAAGSSQVLVRCQQKDPLMHLPSRGVKLIRLMGTLCPARTRGGLKSVCVENSELSVRPCLLYPISSLRLCNFFSKLLIWRRTIFDEN